MGRTGITCAGVTTMARHVRAALLGPSIAVPFKDGRLMLGTWQQIALLEFDTRPRRRDVVVQIVGE